ncbi:hypothetical protein OpiT1DRAFT_00869 [Opitutaceae bacterium TAV1]|nr:hypothetical protein OpiT1DRAFT_00869 [Opitutaceae bacterium TAV1]
MHQSPEPSGHKKARKVPLSGEALPRAGKRGGESHARRVFLCLWPFSFLSVAAGEKNCRTTKKSAKIRCLPDYRASRKSGKVCAFTASAHHMTLTVTSCKTATCATRARAFVSGKQAGKITQVVVIRSLTPPPPPPPPTPPSNSANGHGAPCVRGEAPARRAGNRPPPSGAHDEAPGVGSAITVARSGRSVARSGRLGACSGRSGAHSGSFGAHSARAGAITTPSGAPCQPPVARSAPPVIGSGSSGAHSGASGADSGAPGVGSRQPGVRSGASGVSNKQPVNDT